jgi:thiosulfate dehydrogenase
MTRSMNGRAVPTDGAEMTAIVAYLKFLSTGRPVGAPTFGRGAGEMAELTRAADPTRGKAIYAQSCASCHGGDGQGQRTDHVGDAQGYSTPPLWGDDSFNDGAGMDRLVDAANFIRTNMPDGTMWRQPALSVQDSWDVAAFVLSQPRPHKDHLDRDFPVRTEKPADAAYGPFVDEFKMRWRRSRRRRRATIIKGETGHDDRVREHYPRSVANARTSQSMNTRTRGESCRFGG